MPANDDRHGPKSRHTLLKAISVAAIAIGALVLAACSSTTATVPVAVAATGAASAGTLTGAGSTYVAPFLALALAKYHQQDPAVTVNYSPVGSSAAFCGIRLHMFEPERQQPLTASTQIRGCFFGGGRCCGRCWVRTNVG